MAAVARPKIDLSDQDRQRVREAWGAYREAQREAEKARMRLLSVLRALRKRGASVAAIARAAGVTDMAVWKKLRKK